MHDDAPQLGPDDPTDEQRETMEVAWEHDHSLASGFDLVTNLVGGATLGVGSAKMMLANGLDPSVLEHEVKLTGVQGLLTMTGLQILGLFAPGLRDDIAETIKYLYGTMPDITPEVAEQIEAAANRFADSHFGFADEIGNLDLDIPPEGPLSDASSN